ncbi:hypothetical protein Tco_0431487 [Tanacetum coccineum]
MVSLGNHPLTWKHSLIVTMVAPTLTGNPQQVVVNFLDKDLSHRPNCKKQTIVATSTTEAEYVAAANCCGQVLWVQNQLLDYGFNFMNTKIHIDNESTICIVKNPVYHSKTKHIEIRHHFIRDCYEKKLISVEKIHTDLNVADLLTKPFDGPRFNYLVVSIVGFLRKPDESAGFAEIVDFLRGSNLRYALTTNPTIYDSLVKQFWQSATANTKADGSLEINATIDTIRYTISEASIRDSLQLEDATGITMLPNEELFEGMGQTGYPTDGTFTFWKSFFTPQWRYLVHHLLHCISPKSGGWDQFGSNIATALVCLSTGRVYNFSKLIFDGPPSLICVVIINSKYNSQQMLKLSIEQNTDQSKRWGLLFSEFEKTCKKRITPTGISKGERGFEQTKTCYLTKVIPFFKTLQEHFEGIQIALTKEVKEMSDAFDELEAELDRSIVDRKHDEIERKNFLIKHDNVIADGLSKEVFYVASNYELNVSRFIEMQKANNVVKARCLELEAELSNLRNNIRKDNYNELLNRFSNLEVNHLNLQLKYQNLKDSFQNNPSSSVNDTPDFNSVFVIGQMKTSLQGKDNVIQKLKMQISQLKETRSELDRMLDFRARDFQIS